MRETHHRVMTYAVRSPFGRLPRAKTNFTTVSGTLYSGEGFIYLYCQKAKINPFQSEIDPVRLYPYSA